MGNKHWLFSIFETFFNCLVCLTIMQSKEVSCLLNPLHPDINIYFLHTIAVTILMVRTRRMTSLFSLQSFFLFSWFQFLIEHWCCRDNSDSRHFLGIKCHFVIKQIAGQSLHQMRRQWKVLLRLWWVSKDKVKILAAKQPNVNCEVVYPINKSPTVHHTFW